MTRTFFAIGLTATLATISGCENSSSTSLAPDTSHAPMTADVDYSTIYTVAQYDPSRDPQADFAATVEQATADGKRIILEVGGNW